MTTDVRTIAALALALGSLAAGGSTAMADNRDLYENEVANETSLSADEIENGDLRAFLDASRDMEEARAEYADAIREADSEQKVAELQDEANTEFVSLVEDTDLSVENYREIGKLIREDTELAERLDKVAAGQG